MRKRKRKKNRIENRKHKDTVFRLLYRDKRRLLELYNGLNGTNYTNADDLIINTIEGETYLGMKNDVSFVFHDDLSLFEHQSSPCPNIPLRNLFYVAEIYRKMINISDTYKSQLMKISTPRFIVFYNGTIPMEDEKIYRLSEMFENRMEAPELELTVRVFNINAGHNKELLEACKTLKEYSIFVAKVRKYIEEASLAQNRNGILTIENDKRNVLIEKAVGKAIDECIKDDVLKDFFIEYRKEVIRMGALGYSAQRHLQAVVEEAKEISLEQGMQIGEKKGVKLGVKLGVDIINQLNCALAAAGRNDDIIKAASDPEYQLKLIRELIDKDYGIDK